MVKDVPSQVLDTTSPKNSFSMQYWASPQSLELSQSPFSSSFSSSPAGLGSYPSKQPTKQASESGSSLHHVFGSVNGQPKIFVSYDKSFISRKLRERSGLLKFEP